MNSLRAAQAASDAGWRSVDGKSDSRMESPETVKKAYSTAFLSSRMLPGQE
jgi:hypothetical protein